jgi:zona occludens toxin
MSTKIFHGAPGSYKSSTVCWFELLPALVAGRLVVTNLQGVKTIEEISRELNIVFPASARLVRISTNNDLGRELIRNFFHWLPIGAFIFIDEIQDIYPNDKTFKATDYDYKSEGFWDEKLPAEVKSLYHEKQKLIKSLVDISEFEDDIGLSIFDERDYITYPPTLRESFMRHRHYNWDIVLATPDIKEVSGFIRSVCEAAFAHTSKDSAPFPFFKRRPKVLEHLPSGNGVSTKKGDIVTNRKIPLDVFKIYKSTATGQNTKSGAGSSPVTLSVVLGAIVFVALIAFIIYIFFFRASNVDIDAAAPVPVLNQISKNGLKVSVKDNEKTVNSNNSRITPETLFKNASALILPFRADSIYLVGINKVYAKGESVTADYVFLLRIGQDEFYVNSMDLVVLGYKVSFKSDYVVNLSDGSNSQLVFFAPTKYEKPSIDREETPNFLNTNDEFS